jgi:CRISPR-associated protein Cmr6
MVRSWATSWEDWPTDMQKSNEINQIFGPKESNSVGSVIFLDAIPVRPVQLRGDVMTPHYVPYYQKSDPPGDWHSPVPIPFLVVAPGQEFLFGIMPRNPMKDKMDCLRAKNWLIRALEYIGAGAKTAVGYGRFKQFEPELPKSVAMEWLENLAKNRELTVEDLAKSSKMLADNWAKIEDQKFKVEVMKEIKVIYQKMNWWEEAPSRGTRKIISDVYKAWEA